MGHPDPRGTTPVLAVSLAFFAYCEVVAPLRGAIYKHFSFAK